MAETEAREPEFGRSWIDKVIDSPASALGSTMAAYAGVITVLGWSPDDPETTASSVMLFLVMFLVVYGVREWRRTDPGEIHNELEQVGAEAADAAARSKTEINRVRSEAADAAARSETEINRVRSEAAAQAEAEINRVRAEAADAMATAAAASAIVDEHKHLLRSLNVLTKHKMTELFEATTATYEVEPDGSAWITSERKVTVPKSSHLYWRRLNLTGDSDLAPEDLVRRTWQTKADGRQAYAFPVVDTPTALHTVVFFEPPVAPDDETTVFTWTHRVYWPKYFADYASKGLGVESVIGVATGCITITVILPPGHVISASTSPTALGDLDTPTMSDGRSCAVWTIRSAVPRERHVLSFQNLAHAEN